MLTKPSPNSILLIRQHLPASTRTISHLYQFLLPTPFRNLSQNGLMAKSTLTLGPLILTNSKISHRHPHLRLTTDGDHSNHIPEVGLHHDGTHHLLVNHPLHAQKPPPRITP